MIFFAFVFAGTKSDSFAGLRACSCLEGHYRVDMFDQCRKCSQGLICQEEFATLRPGYWWRWRNTTRKDRYKVFIANLLSKSVVDKRNVHFPHLLPSPYKCPDERSCKGGLDSSCEEGYSGPLCSVCTKGHYKQAHQCKKCPSAAWIATQLVIVAITICLIIAFCVWTSKKKSSKDGGDVILSAMFLSKIKIAIGFYQVTNGLLQAFSYIKWPGSMRVISKYSEILQFNILEIAPVHCLSSGLKADVFANLFSMMTINGAMIAFAGITFIVFRLVILRDKTLEGKEKSIKISGVKETIYRNLFFFLYVTYLDTCSKTASVLPLACRELCHDKNEDHCLEYLRTDLSIQCHDSQYKNLAIIAYLCTVYVLALPVATFIILWRKRKDILMMADGEEGDNQRLGSEVTMGLQFLFENYKGTSWYWEFVEMSRKVIITSGLILIGQESRSYIGLAWVIAGIYGVFFAWNHPIQDAFENRLMTTSVAVTVFNLGIGSVSKIPSENVPTSTDSYIDTFTFNILILGANTLVIALLACKLVRSRHFRLSKPYYTAHYPGFHIIKQLRMFLVPYRHEVFLYTRDLISSAL